jgi:acyl-CoA thioester hydrolase
MSGSSRPQPGRSDEYRHHVDITTRWMDNDAYGHINNVTYYSFFDTAVNRWLIDSGVLDIERSEVIGLVVETGCRYFRPLAYPMPVRVGIRVAHLGTSSVRYEVGVFAGDDPEAAAEGHFVHVYVARATQRPTPLPAPLRAALETIRVP